MAFNMTENSRAQDEPRSQTRIQSVSRAVALLLAVAESENGVTAKALSVRFGLSLPTTYHLLTTLWAEGLLAKDDARTFRLGLGAATIAEGYQRHSSVPAAYHRALQKAVNRTGETAYLSVWRGSGVKVLETVEGAHAVRVVGLDVGYSEDMHARASGKLLLAFASHEVREMALDGMQLRQLTPHTITKKSALIKELAEIRRAGLSFDREEFQLGVTCVSAPIWSGDGVAACITVSSPTNRFEVTEKEVISALLDVTSELGVPNLEAVSTAL
jgi:IclR family transcriptional regulator, acetate operon repressor